MHLSSHQCLFSCLQKTKYAYRCLTKTLAKLTIIWCLHLSINSILLWDWFAIGKLKALARKGGSWYWHSFYVWMFIEDSFKNYLKFLVCCSVLLISERVINYTYIIDGVVCKMTFTDHIDNWPSKICTI